MKKTHFTYIFLFFCCAGISFVRAQSVDIYLTEDHIFNRNEYSNNIPSSNLVLGWGGGWRPDEGTTVCLKAKNSNFSNSGQTLPNNIILFHLVSINGRTPGSPQLEGNWPNAKTLNTSFQSFFEPFYYGSYAESGPVLMKYTISSDKLESNAWRSGVYENVLDTNQDYPILGWRKYLSPSNWAMNIHVPAIIKWIVSQDSYFKNYSSINELATPEDLVFDLSNFQFAHTIDAKLQIKAQGNINFIPHGGGATSTLPINLVTASGSGLQTKNLSTSYQNLKTGSFSVVEGNRTQVPLLLKIKSNDVKQYLYKAGTYTFNVDLNVVGNSGTPNDTKSVAFTITTSPLNNISVQGSQEVNFIFQNAADYQLGQSKNMANHLLVTNNKPFEIYVKSAASHFTLNGSPTTIPASIIQIENGDGQTGIITRSLGTSPKAIITGASPSLNQNISLKYSIPAAQAPSLIGQSTGATPYVLNVIYSFTNQ